VDRQLLPTLLAANVLIKVKLGILSGTQVLTSFLPLPVTPLAYRFPGYPFSAPVPIFQPNPLQSQLAAI